MDCGERQMNKLLELRNAKKAKKPTFKKQDSHKWDRLSDSWRQPKGGDSKLRKKRRGKSRHPSMGFSSPRKVRGLNKLGFEEVLVKNVDLLDSIDVKTQVVLVGRVGKKKKIEIVKKCEEMKLNIANVKDIKSFIAEVDKKMADKKKKIKDIEEKKAKRVKKDDKKAKKEEVKEEKKEEQPKEETKKGEKSDKIKVLEKGQ
jgi:large subunit ribosomal protein L32e